jgi:hypothetical protein
MTVTEPTVPAAGESTTLTLTVTCKPGVLEYSGSASGIVVQKGESDTASSKLASNLLPISSECVLFDSGLSRNTRVPQIQPD